MTRTSLGWLGLSVFLACLLALPACGGRQRYGYSRPATAATIQWQPVAPPGAGFQAHLPGRPATGAEQDVADDGARIRSTRVSTEAPWGMFAVLVNEWEGGVVGDPLMSVAELARHVFENAEVTRERSQRLTVDGYYAREDIGHGQDQTFVAMRQYVGADRVILAVAVVPAQSQDALAIAHRFMESIRLDPANALFPQQGARHADGSWTAVYLPESDFAIRMPSAPAHTEGEVAVAGARAHLATFESRDDWGIYRVRVIGFADGVPEGAYEAVRQRMALEREVRPVSTSGFPGRVYTTDRDGTRRWTRMYQTQGRVYVVEAIGSRASLRDRARAHALMRYFDSFRIL